MNVTRQRKRALAAGTVKPRNPLVALARVRKAGSHSPDSRALRHRARQALRKEPLE